jgi:hypothetical protein
MNQPRGRELEELVCAKLGHLSGRQSPPTDAFERVAETRHIEKFRHYTVTPLRALELPGKESLAARAIALVVVLANGQSS